VVDDGSTDNRTLEALTELELVDGVRVLHKRNGGLASARNFGTMHARSEFVLYLDNDDRVEPFTVQLLLLKLLESPNISYSSCSEGTGIFLDAATVRNSVISSICCGATIRLCA
jgi:glycosyltransferase involved in cell wall biosynthesis